MYCTTTTPCVLLSSRASFPPWLCRMRVVTEYKRKKKKEKSRVLCVVPFGENRCPMPITECPLPPACLPACVSACLPPSFLQLIMLRGYIHPPQPVNLEFVYIHYLRIPAMALLYAVGIEYQKKKKKNHLCICPKELPQVRIMRRFRGQVRQLCFGGFAMY